MFNSMIKSGNILVAALFTSFFCVGLIGCGNKAEPTVIAPTEVFQEDPAVAAAKAEEVERTKNDPL